jgi:hypothetical protein
VERDLSRDRPLRNLVRTTEQGIGPAPTLNAKTEKAQPDHSILGNPYRAGGPRMPRSEKSNRGLRHYVFFAQQTDRGKTGAAWLELTVGLALCAATQIEQKPDSLSGRDDCGPTPPLPSTTSRTDRATPNISSRTASLTESCFLGSCIRLIKA